ncbi:hypothetical protein LPJ57_008143 [Coemansia sp. RSA 486]|nr:hypothetical protein LPJ57_008143 [Coemansia sp. RSA 486]
MAPVMVVANAENLFLPAYICVSFSTIMFLPPMRGSMRYSMLWLRPTSVFSPVIWLYFVVGAIDTVGMSSCTFHSSTTLPYSRSILNRSFGRSWFISTMDESPSCSMVDDGVNRLPWVSSMLLILVANWMSSLSVCLNTPMWLPRTTNERPCLRPISRIEFLAPSPELTDSSSSSSSSYSSSSSSSLSDSESLSPASQLSSSESSSFSGFPVLTPAGSGAFLND